MTLLTHHEVWPIEEINPLVDNYIKMASHYNPILPTNDIDYNH